MSNLTLKGRPLSDLRVIDLKEELDKRSLSRSGNKTVLFERLKEALLLEQQSNGGEQPLADTASKPDCGDIVAAPNVAMKDCGSVVAEYLEKQQEALQYAKKAKEQAIAVSSEPGKSGSEEDKTEELPAIEAAGGEDQQIRSSAGGGGSRESSPRSADPSSPRGESAVDDEEGESRSRSRRNPKQTREEQEEGEDSGSSGSTDNGKDEDDEDDNHQEGIILKLRDTFSQLVDM